MSSTNGSCICMPSLRRFGGIVATALVLSVPAFAISALSNSRGTPAVTIQAQDDAVAALNIVKSPVDQVKPTAAQTQDSDGAVIVIQKFEKTGHQGSGVQ
jgi:hypothetical protein